MDYSKSHIVCVFPTHASLYGKNLHTMPKNPSTYLYPSSMGSRTLRSRNINSISFIQGKILCLWGLGQPYTTIQAPSLLFSSPRYIKTSLALILLSYWRFFYHWLNFRRVFGQHPIGALCRFFTLLFFRYSIGMRVDDQLTGNFFPSSIYIYIKTKNWKAYIGDEVDEVNFGCLISYIIGSWEIWLKSKNYSHL